MPFSKACHQLRVGGMGQARAHTSEAAIRLLGEGSVDSNRVGCWPSRSHAGLELPQCCEPKGHTCCAVGRSSGLSLKHCSMRSQISCKAQQAVGDELLGCGRKT